MHYARLKSEAQLTETIFLFICRILLLMSPVILTFTEFKDINNNQHGNISHPEILNIALYLAV